MAERIERVRVTNRNPFQINDMHDGVPYEFPPGQTVIIPVEAAAHIFGWPAEPPQMALFIARRHGWNRPEHYSMPKDEQAAKAIGVDYPSTLLPWQTMTRKITLSVEHYEVRRVVAAGAPLLAEDAEEATEIPGINTDPPLPRRTVVDARSRNRRKPRPMRRTVKQVTEEHAATAAETPAPASFGRTEGQ